MERVRKESGFIRVGEGSWVVKVSHNRRVSLARVGEGSAAVKVSRMVVVGGLK